MTWKVRVSKSNVSLFQLQAKVLGIKETEFGLLATPNTMDHLPPRSKKGTLKLQQGHRKGRTRPSNLREQVDPQTMAMYPTPTVSCQYGKPITDMRDVEKHLRSKKQSFPTPTTFDSNEINKPRKPHSGGGQKPPLNQVVKMYPTPTVSCQMDVVASPETVKQNKSGWTVTRKKSGTRFGAKLNDVVNKLETEMLPTPRARDYKDLAYNPNWKPHRDKTLPNQVLKNNTHGGKLNADFVSFLMGYPTTWTKIESTE